MSNTPPFDSDRRVISAPAAGTVAIDFDFPIQSETELFVVRRRGGVVKALDFGGEYIVASVSSTGGRISLSSPTLAGDLFVLDGRTVEERISSYLGGGDFSSAKIDADFQHLTKILQEHRRDIGDSLMFPPGFAGSRVLPDPADGRGLEWNGLLARYENGPTIEELAQEIIDRGLAGNATHLDAVLNANSVTIRSSSGDDAIIPSATDAKAGVMSAEQAGKLAGVEAGAQKNVVNGVGNAGSATDGVAISAGLDDQRIARQRRLKAMAGVKIEQAADYISIGLEKTGEDNGGYRAMGFVIPEDYGAVGDGAADDTQAVQAALNSRFPVFFPGKTYRTTGVTCSGRKIIDGVYACSVLVGGLTFRESDFPWIVDVPGATQESPTSKYFSCRNLMFQTTGAEWGLQIICTNDPKFITNFNIGNLKFFGRNGLRTEYCGNSTMRNCEFFSTAIGIQGDGSTNINVVACQFWNQAAYGVRLKPVDAEGATGRKGGELWRLTACDWAGCATAVKATQCGAFTMIGCMQDYCGLPTHLEGCHSIWLLNNYLGSSRHYRGQSGLPGYVAPATDDIALYCTPKFDGRGSYGFNGHISQNAFVGYHGAASSPVVFFDDLGIAGLPIQWLVMSSNSVQRNGGGPHSAPDLMRLKGVAGFTITGTYFEAVDTSSANVEPVLVLGGTPSERITLIGSLTYNVARVKRSTYEGYVSGVAPGGAGGGSTSTFIRADQDGTVHLGASEKMTYVYGNIGMYNGGYISNVPDPTLALRAVNKNYVDSRFSDARLKKNVADLRNGLAIVNQFRPVTFDYTDPALDFEYGRLAGIIAQEARDVLPGVVIERAPIKLIDEDGNVSEMEAPLGVDYVAIVPYLLGAIQELSARIDALTGET